MIKVSNNLITFVGLAIIVSITAGIALQRVLFSTLQNTVYSCQAFVQSLALQVPHGIVLLPLFLLYFLLISIIIKFTLTFLRIYLLKKRIIYDTHLYPTLKNVIEKLMLGDKTVLIENNKPFAFCFGLRKPKIYISTALLTLSAEKELQAILLHEKYHLRNKDIWSVLIISTIKLFFPFFPLFSDFLKNFQIEQEIKADQEAIKVMGSSQPIVSILKKLLLASSSPVIYTPALASRETLEPRIKAIVKKDFNFKKFTTTNIIISLFSMIFLAAAIYSPVQAVDIHNKHYDSVFLCVSGKECISACRNQDSQPSNAIKRYSPAVNASFNP